LKEDNKTEETKNVTEVKPLISSATYDAEGNYYPANGAENSKNEQPGVNGINTNDVPVSNSSVVNSTTSAS
jgi:hypothetical protein